MKRPLVSICCITYNHEKYISEAIEGFLIQRTSFPIEIIIHDDASNDRTPEILKKYQVKYPDIIKPIFQKYNQFSQGKKITMIAMSKARGKYIALCEGDDYWTHPLKLQKQVEFLEGNPQFSFCANYYYTRMGEELKKMTLPYDEVNSENIFMKNIFSTASLLFRDEALKELPLRLIENVSAGDWALQAFACRNGPGFALPEYMSVYRLHEQGLWSSLPSSEMGRKGVEVLKQFLSFFDTPQEQDLIKKAILRRNQDFNLNDKVDHRKKVKIKSALKHLIKRLKK